jgi:hypothetical protein
LKHAGAGASPARSRDSARRDKSRIALGSVNKNEHADALVYQSQENLANPRSNGKWRTCRAVDSIHENAVAQAPFGDFRLKKALTFFTGEPLALCF